DQIEAGEKINLGRLGDLRFSSQFAVVSAAKSARPAFSSVIEAKGPPPAAAIEELQTETKLTRFSDDSAAVGRNALQTASMGATLWKPELPFAVDTVTEEDMRYVDAEGNTSMLLAVYRGNRHIVKALAE